MAFSQITKKYPKARSMVMVYMPSSIIQSSFSLFSQYFLYFSRKMTLLSLTFFEAAVLMNQSLSYLLTICSTFCSCEKLYYFYYSSRAWRRSRSMKFILWYLGVLALVYRLCSRVILALCFTFEWVQRAEQLRQDLPHQHMKSRPESSFLLRRLRRFYKDESICSSPTYIEEPYSTCSIYARQCLFIIIIQIFIIHCLNPSHFTLKSIHFQISLIKIDGNHVSGVFGLKLTNFFIKQLLIFYHYYNYITQIIINYYHHYNSLELQKQTKKQQISYAAITIITKDFFKNCSQTNFELFGANNWAKKFRICSICYKL